MSDLFEEILVLEPDDDPDSLQSVTYRLSQIKTTSVEEGATILSALGFLIHLKEMYMEVKCIWKFWNNGGQRNEQLPRI